MSSRKEIFLLLSFVLTVLNYHQLVNKTNFLKNSNFYFKNACNILSINSTFFYLFGLQSIDINEIVPSSDTLSEDLGVYSYDRILRPSGQHPKSLPYLRYKKNFLRTSIEIDSTGKKIINRIMFDSIPISYEFERDLDAYLKIRKRELQNEIWDSTLNKYDLKEALSGGDLARLISQSTGLTIPVPPNPVIGLFGKPEISINVSGEVNLKVGWRWDSQNLGTVSAFGQTQSTPIFSQDIRVNVSGGIGDKLRLKTDWNTRRQFEYDNKFKIGYEGEDDEIIKLIEVGNVSLPVPSSLIGGGESLFGVRSDYQFGPLYLKTIFSQKRGERKFVDVKGGTSSVPFQIRAYDYSRNHFFPG